MTASEMGAADGTKARERNEKRGRVFTPKGACKACGNAFMRLLDRKHLEPADVVAYGTAFIKAALGEP